MIDPYQNLSKISEVFSSGLGHGLCERKEDDLSLGLFFLLEARGGLRKTKLPGIAQTSAITMPELDIE